MDIKLLTKLKKKAIHKYKITTYYDDRYKYMIVKRDMFFDWFPMYFHLHQNLNDAAQDLTQVRRKYICDRIQKLKFRKTKKNTEQQIKIINSNW